MQLFSFHLEDSSVNANTAQHFPAKWQKQGPTRGPWQSEYLSRESQFLLRREAFVKEFEIVGIFLGYEIQPRGVVNSLDTIQKASRQRFSTVL